MPKTRNYQDIAEDRLPPRAKPFNERVPSEIGLASHPPLPGQRVPHAARPVLDSGEQRGIKRRSIGNVRAVAMAIAKANLARKAAQSAEVQTGKKISFTPRTPPKLLAKQEIEKNKVANPLEGPVDSYVGGSSQEERATRPDELVRKAKAHTAVVGELKGALTETIKDRLDRQAHEKFLASQGEDTTKEDILGGIDEGEPDTGVHEGLDIQSADPKAISRKEKYVGLTKPSGQADKVREFIAANPALMRGHIADVLRAKTVAMKKEADGGMPLEHSGLPGVSRDTPHVPYDESQSSLGEIEEGGGEEEFNQPEIPGEGGKQDPSNIAPASAKTPEALLMAAQRRPESTESPLKRNVNVHAGPHRAQAVPVMGGLSKLRSSLAKINVRRYGTNKEMPPIKNKLAKQETSKPAVRVRGGANDRFSAIERLQELPEQLRTRVGRTPEEKEGIRSLISKMAVPKYRSVEVAEEKAAAKKANKKKAS